MTSKMCENDLGNIKHKATKGVLSLIARQVILQLVGLAGNIALARLLLPEVFGIYAICNFIIVFFATFGDIGLGAALIQKKDELTEKDLQTVFTVQQVLVGVIVLLIFLMAPMITQFYRLERSVVWLIRALSISLFVSSLRSIPALKLEKELYFHKLAMVEVAEAFAFTTVAVSMAFLGFQVWSFAVAVLARGLIGLTIIYTISPWRPRYHLDWSVAKKLISFGLPYQLNAIIHLIKDNITPTAVAAYLGAKAVGYINWAQTLALYPLVLVNIVGRVGFPTYSKIQDDPVILRKAVEKTLRILTWVVYPAVTAIVLFAPQIINFIFSPKWMPALPIVRLYSVAAFIAPISATLAQTLYSIGKAKTVMYLTVLWTIIGWGITALFMVWKGLLGVGIAYAFVALTVIIEIYLFNKFCRVEIVRNIWFPFLNSAITSLIMIALTYFLPVNDIFWLLLYGIGFFVIYVGLTFIFMRKLLNEVFTMVKRI